MKAYNGLPASAETITHLKRELVQKVWELLLDDEFMEAYENGIVITCADGVTRQNFPRFFTYSADYPESEFFIFKSFNTLSHKHYRVILSTIRYLAACPLPRTLLLKKYIPALGTTADEQRRQHLRIDDEH